VVIRKGGSGAPHSGYEISDAHRGGWHERGENKHWRDEYSCERERTKGGGKALRNQRSLEKQLMEET